MKVIDLVRISTDIKLENVGDNKLAKFSIVCNDSKGNGSFYKACAWNRVGENISKFLQKGSQIHIDADIANNNYQGKEGMVYQELVTIHSFKFASPKKEQQENNYTKPQEQVDNTDMYPERTQAQKDYNDTDNSDLPF